METVLIQMFAIVHPVGMAHFVIIVSVVLPPLSYKTCLSLAICSPTCQHLSTCIAPSTCNCTTGYNGSVCQLRKFS
jgi:hypothetical protein